MTKLIDAINDAKTASKGNKELLDGVLSVLENKVDGMPTQMKRKTKRLAKMIEFETIEEFSESLDELVTEIEVEFEIKNEAAKKKRKKEEADPEIKGDDDTDVSEDCDDDEDDDMDSKDESDDEDEPDEDDKGGASDDDEDDDKKTEMKKKKSKMKRESALEKMLAILEVSDSQLDEFKAVLRTELVRSVKESSAAVEKRLKAEYNEKLDEVRAEAQIRVKKYVDKAAANFAETYAVEAVNADELASARKFMESFVNLARDYNMSVDPELNEIKEAHDEALAERNSKIDELTDTVHTLKHSVLLHEVETHAQNIAKGLTLSDKNRFNEMIAELDFVNAEDFKMKAESIREKYFDGESEVEVRDSDLIIETDNGAEELGIVFESRDEDVGKKDLLSAIRKVQR